jgi:hypothetical protein
MRFFFSASLPPLAASGRPVGFNGDLRRGACGAERYHLWRFR